MADSKAEVSYCGLYCPGCDLHVSDRTKQGRQEEKGVPSAHTQSSKEELPWISEFKSHLLRLGQSTQQCSGCKAGGGARECEVRTCASDRGYSTCLDCLRITSCRHLDSRPWAQPSLDKIRDTGFEKWLKTKQDLVGQGWTYSSL